MVFIPSMKLVSQWFRISEFATMTAILNVMGGMGALTAAAPLALMSGWVGWRDSFAIIAGGTLVIAGLVWLLVRNRPQDMGWPSLAEIDRASIETGDRPKEIPLWDGARRVLTNRHFWPIVIWFFCVGGIFFSFGGLWAGPYLSHVYGMNRSDAGSVLNMFAVGLVLGSPAMSLLSDRIFQSRKQVLSLSTALLIVELVFLNLFPSELSRYALYLAFFIFSVTSAAIVVIGFTTTKELFPVEIAGTAVGTLNLFPFLGGAIFQPGIGWILDAYPKTGSDAYSLDGYQVMFLVLLVASVVALAATLIMKETFPESMKTRNYRTLGQ